MKTLRVLAIAGLGFIAFGTSAQESNTLDAKWPQKQTEQIKSNVTGVTPDQESKILAIEQNYSKTVQDAFDKRDGDNYTFHNKVLQMQKDRDAKIQAVLSADQYAQYDKAFNTPQK